MSSLKHESDRSNVQENIDRTMLFSRAQDSASSIYFSEKLPVSYKTSMHQMSLGKSSCAGSKLPSQLPCIEDTFTQVNRKLFPSSQISGSASDSPQQALSNLSSPESRDDKLLVNPELSLSWPSPFVSKPSISTFVRKIESHAFKSLENKQANISSKCTPVQTNITLSVRPSQLFSPSPSSVFPSAGSDPYQATPQRTLLKSKFNRYFPNTVSPRFCNAKPNKSFSPLNAESGAASSPNVETLTPSVSSTIQSKGEAPLQLFSGLAKTLSSLKNNTIKTSQCGPSRGLFTDTLSHHQENDIESTLFVRDECRASYGQPILNETTKRSSTIYFPELDVCDVIEETELEEIPDETVLYSPSIFSNPNNDKPPAKAMMLVKPFISNQIQVSSPSSNILNKSGPTDDKDNDIKEHSGNGSNEALPIVFPHWSMSSTTERRVVIASKDNKAKETKLLEEKQMSASKRRRSVMDRLGPPVTANQNIERLSSCTTPSTPNRDSSCSSFPLTMFSSPAAPKSSPFNIGKPHSTFSSSPANFSSQSYNSYPPHSLDCASVYTRAVPSCALIKESFSSPVPASKLLSDSEVSREWRGSGDENVLMEGAASHSVSLSDQCGSPTSCETRFVKEESPCSVITVTNPCVDTKIESSEDADNPSNGEQSFYYVDKVS